MANANLTIEKKQATPRYDTCHIDRIKRKTTEKKLEQEGNGGNPKRIKMITQTKTDIHYGVCDIFQCKSYILHYVQKTKTELGGFKNKQ